MDRGYYCVYLGERRGKNVFIGNGRGDLQQWVTKSSAEANARKCPVLGAKAMPVKEAPLVNWHLTSPRELALVAERNRIFETVDKLYVSLYATCDREMLVDDVKSLAGIVQDLANVICPQDLL